ncbi:hypothetical protein CCAN11_2230012 [Capnocytophaga canimorsus]|uniref:Insertion element IS1 1/5/6 protein insB n=1 Tax=Capnocytophaga canimorsus TaxID=28188 RepID=A0A0B7ILU8_9FLAO|nr:hypothetical protein CCAN11_2230012 [Capnocytophaga canimorsus]
MLVLMRFVQIIGKLFASVFQEYTHKVGKKYTTDIEGNNILLRHRIRRAVRKTCCFSKKFENHIKSL